MEDAGWFRSYLSTLRLTVRWRRRRLALCREDTIDDTQMYRQQMAAMGGVGGVGTDTQKLFDQERQALELVRGPRLGARRLRPCDSALHA